MAVVGEKSLVIALGGKTEKVKSRVLVGGGLCL